MKNTDNGGELFKMLLVKHQQRRWLTFYCLLFKATSTTKNINPTPPTMAAALVGVLHQQATRGMHCRWRNISKGARIEGGIAEKVVGEEHQQRRLAVGGC
ncbi:hypothetical protein [Chryseolinea serpens]|uniref:hypothetical protein n=1 Tax=Chryseolinea serpens TaxID=947013 RepID=UPI001161179F|nr:hypothetical protein [Chryseolinea serpens]